jgi:DNA-binding XRE family transcriptional regulator
VNPVHLFLGTTKDNVKDMIAKGRHPVGERSGASVLKDFQVIEIKRLNKELGYGKWRLGKMFGVGRTTISWILKGRTWAHLP